MYVRVIVIRFSPHCEADILIQSLVFLSPPLPDQARPGPVRFHLFQLGALPSRISAEKTNGHDHPSPLTEAVAAAVAVAEMAPEFHGEYLSTRTSPLPGPAIYDKDGSKLGRQARSRRGRHID